MTPAEKAKELDNNPFLWRDFILDSLFDNYDPQFLMKWLVHFGC